MTALRRLLRMGGSLAILAGVLATPSGAEVGYAPEVPGGPVCTVVRWSSGGCDSGPKVELGGRVAPTPRRGARLPASLALYARIHNFAYQGAGVAPVESIAFALDRGAHLDFDGIPGCYPAVAARRRACRSAVVGSGTVEFLIQSGDVGEPMPVRAKLVIYKAPAIDGETMLRAQVRQAPVVLPQALTVRAARDGKGSLPTTLKVAIPEFDGGYGALTSLQLLLRKNLPSENGRVSPLTERCSSGRSVVDATARFRDGMTSSIEQLSRCAGAPQRGARSR